MGRHSDPDPKWFWLSLGAAAAKAVLIVAVAIAAVVGVVRWLGPDATQAPDVPAVNDPEVTTAPVVQEDSALADPVLSEDFDDDEGAALDDELGDETPVAATVQVLNASGDAAALAHVVAVLEELGYEVVSEGTASRGYDQTTLFWSEGFQIEAMELHRADKRFAVVQSNQKLDASINMHVVIGADWVVIDGAD